MSTTEAKDTKRQCGLTRIVPVVALPLFIPAQYKLPTTKRTTQVKVMDELMIIRRPNLSMVKSQRMIPKRLTQLEKED